MEHPSPVGTMTSPSGSASASIRTLPAFTITPLSSHTYAANLDDSWCIGTVPHGGYITSLFLCVARTHFETTHASLNQPHPITLNLQFVRRTSHGPAVFTVRDTKLGSRTSVIHVSLSQTEEDDDNDDDNDGVRDKDKDRQEVVGYITHSNLATEKGLTLDTSFRIPASLSPPPPAVDLPLLLRNGEDPNWKGHFHTTFPNFRKASRHGLYYLPKAGQAQRSIVDEWMRFRPHGRPTGWTHESLGYLVDMFPQVVEAWYPGDDDLEPEPEPETDPAAGGGGGNQRRKKPIARYWYPTLSLNLEIKKLLPDDGSVTWLFQRARSKKIHNGRFDYECVVGDEQGDVVAVAAHTSLVMGVGRNMARGSEKGKL